MDPLPELLAVPEIEALRYFCRVFLEKAGERDEAELLYVASVHAHFATTSTQSVNQDHFATLSHLGQFFDLMLLNRSEISDPWLLEHFGAQILLFVGFFRDQVRGRHNVSWYETLGSGYYKEASELFVERGRGYESQVKLCDKMSQSFPDWAEICSRISRELRDERYILRLN